MKRITVSLPDELAEQVKRAAGGERRVSSYVAAALEDYAERENLEQVLASRNAESPVPDEVRRQVPEDLHGAGRVDRPRREGRLAGARQPRPPRLPSPPRPFPPSSTPAPPHAHRLS